MKAVTSQDNISVSQHQDSETELRRQLAELGQTAEPDADTFAMNLSSALRQVGEPDPPPFLAGLREWLAYRPVATGAMAGFASAAMAIFAYQAFNSQHAPELQTQASPSAQYASAQANKATVSDTVKTEEQAPVATTLPKDKVALIRFEFRSEVSIEDAEFHIELPEGLTFWSEGRALAETSFTWTGTLKEGANEVVTAIRASHEGRYRVLATAWVDDEPLIHEVILHVVSPENNDAG